MSSQPIRVLLIEDDPDASRSLQDLLAQARAAALTVVAAPGLADGLACLAQSPPDVVLLDLSLPDSQGQAALARLRTESPSAAIVVLAGREDDWLDLGAVRDEAQDYLVKGQYDSQFLWRCIRTAIQTRRLETALRDLTLTDPLTGLHNRRGFFTLAEQYFKLARRTQHSLVLVCVDIDGLKQINQGFGRAEGDRALVLVATVLRNYFRESDIMARMQADEFAFVALGATDRNAEALAARLGDGLQAMTVSDPRPYVLTLSAGMAWFNPDQPEEVEDLVARASAAMQEHQQRKRAA